VVQDIYFAPTTKVPQREYYIAVQKATYRAELPAGATAALGTKVSELWSWLSLREWDERTQNPGFLGRWGVLLLSAGQLSNMLSKDQDLFHAERAQVWQRLAILRGQAPGQARDAGQPRDQPALSMCSATCSTRPIHVAFQRS